MTRTIYVVDDEPSVTNIVPRRLAEDGIGPPAYAARTFETVREAMEAYPTDRPALVISDNTTGGGKSGLDFVESLRASGDLTPFILNASFTTDTDRDRAAALEAAERAKISEGGKRSFAYLQKPNGILEMADVVKLLLRD